jgi:multisubunit Na+/H+ antiporter MnhF subunit
MAESLHPAAPHHLPSFITAPGETDVLMVVMGFVLLLAILMFGILFFRLHSLPERVAHKSHKIQFEIVAILCLIALFTHTHILWVAALLLAMIDLPDFGGSLARIATSAEKIADVRPGEGADAPQAMAAIRQVDESRGASLEARGAVKEGEGAALPTKPDIPPAHKKERSHA